MVISKNSCVRIAGGVEQHVDVCINIDKNIIYTLVNEMEMNMNHLQICLCTRLYEPGL